MKYKLLNFSQMQHVLKTCLPLVLLSMVAGSDS